MKRILIIKLWALGDILMATPMLTTLRARYPDVQISWMVDAENAPLLAGHPLIDELISCDTGAWRRLLRQGNLAAWLAQARALRAQMQAQRFDAVINCHPDKWWSRVLCAAPVRIGLFPSPRLPLSRLGYTRAIARTKQSALHNTDHYLLATQALGCPPADRRMRLHISPEDWEAAHRFLEAQAGYSTRHPLIILHPGTSQATKCWPAEHYAAVAAALQPEHTVVVTGSPSEAPLATAILHALPPGAQPPLIAAGRLTHLRQTAALVESAAAVVTGDTSLLHIASALEIPVVGIYGATRPRDNAPLFGPQALLYEDAIPCAPCFRASCPLHGTDHLRCLRAVTPPQVLAALQKLLKESQESDWFVPGSR